MAGPVVRVAAVGDLHCARTSQGAFQALFSRIAESAEVLLLAGDLTDYGLPEEARVLAKELAAVRMPTAAVLGNHDFESDKQDEIRQILTDAGVTVLDGDACELHGIGIAGVKGFGGGFGKRALGPWGEPIIKQFVHEAVNEALKLEAALARLRTDRLVALLHYAPVQETHRGQLEGRTKSGVPVFNVSMPLLTRSFPDRPPFRVFEVGEPAAASPAAFNRGRRATDAVAS
jgi:Icc-related predicted phosphoesterase